MVTATMNAISISGIKKVESIQVEVPKIDSDEVLVKIGAVGVCGTDLEIYHGVLSFLQDGRASFPIIPGHEWAGVVVAVGDEVSSFAIGDHVVGETTIPCRRCEFCKSGKYNVCPNRLETGILGKDGAAAEFLVYPASGLYKYHPDISFQEACIIEPAAVAYRGVKLLNITPKDRVAVFGAGPIGLLSVQMAKLFGAKEVTLFDMLENRLEVGKKIGADKTINLSEQALDTSEKFSVLIEASGNPVALENMVSAADLGASLCLLGVCGGRRASLDVDKVVTSEMNILGSISSPGVWDTVVELIASKKVNTTDIVSHTLKMSELQNVFEMMERRDETLIKAVLLNDFQ
ncbi:zinc-dependent alcohol dehydrogenase [Bacillus sp. T33-2]|uniref:zinc-dependent alcohol dehydrogenase n=1 Tax=Bacillus sp. T33-2 TaxID=2054168 RepID=UPI000C76FD0D|nr:alcohol dehydrogenase catalytic domain-containing protein [Bacillus sp. T33-2]PLR94673.1 hypothetical protein CVD19_17070 [Bacillus sp. T33-2]